MFVYSCNAQNNSFIIQLFLIIELQCLKVVNGNLRLRKEYHDTSSKAGNVCDDEWAVYYKTIVSFEVSTVVKLYVVAGAHEPPKVAKEHETYTSCQVPSQSKFIGHHNQIVFI